MKLFCFGIGYTAGHYLAEGSAFERASGTVRTVEKATALRAGGGTVFRFDEPLADDGIGPALAAADLLLVSVQPGRDGDPVLSRFAAAIAAAPTLRRIVYLSTVGVYGDHGGGWVDEATPPAPQNERGRVRVEVERAWMELGGRAGKAVDVLRLAGIYGPGRNALDDLANGEARRIVKPGQVFNRVHVSDIGAAIDAAFASPGPGRVWNVTDDEPAPAQAVVAYAAELAGVAPPPEIAIEDASLSPMARSFYAANRRVSNRAIKDRLGLRLRYPTFRDGLRALWAAGEGRS